LRRNFRNTKEAFRAAYVAHASQLERDKIKSSARRFAKEFAGHEQGIEFERAEGRYPIIERIDMRSLHDEDPSSAFFAEEEQGILASKYRQIIEEQIRYLDERHRPIDLLLLVPSEKCVEVRAARRALDELDQDFADLTDQSSRRDPVPSSSVRLCTFHSARGIEGHRVVILGLSHLPRLCERIGLERPENLLYVILTRAVFETTIVVRSDESNDDIVLLVEEIIDHLSSRNSSE
jgi:superfamily I DNA/RNA helicase